MSVERLTEGSPEKQTKNVLKMTLTELVDFAYKTRSQENVRRLRQELLRRKANVPEGMTIMAIDQAYAIIDDRYNDLLESLR